jgi:hypothetical protein
MAYLKNVDTSAKVGFRPYYQTDAFGAAHLSGYGSGLGQNHPFKPQAWHLHGVDGSFLGTYHLNRPFDPWELYADVHETAGARGLHGWEGLGDLGGTDVTAAAADELLAAGHMTQAEHDAILEGSMTFQDVVGFDPTDQSSWTSLTSLFREVNQDLQALEQQYAASVVPGAPANPAAAQLGRDLIAMRTQYNDLASQFVHYYTLVIGSAPSGLAGLGIVPIIWVAGAAVFLITAFAVLYALRNQSKQIDVNKITAQAQLQAAGTDTQLADMLARQQAAGDTVGANATIALMKQRAVAQPGSGSMEQWLMTNAKWIGLGAAGLIVLGPLSQGLFGRRR